MRNASGVNQFKAVDQNGNNGMLFKVKDNSEFSVNVWKDNAFGNEKILATKDDLTKSIDFRGNAKMFKVRSGTDGLKNIYLDIEDESGNTCSLAFLSDGENTVKLILNGKTVWTK